MLRFGLAATGLALAIGAIACSNSGEPTSSSSSEVAEAKDAGTVPIHCESPKDPGLAVKKLGLSAKADLVGIANGRAYLRSASKSCESRKLDGSDAKPCPSPAEKLVAAEGDDLWFEGGGTIFHVSADGTATILYSGAEGPATNTRLVGDVFVWTASDSRLMSMAKAGGKAKLLVDASIHGYGVFGSDIVTGGEGGLRVLSTTDGFLTVGEPKLVPIPDDDGKPISDVRLSDKTIGFRQGDKLWTMDRASGERKLAFNVLKGETVTGFEMVNDELFANLEYRQAPKPTIYAYARFAKESGEMVIGGPRPITNVTRLGDAIYWSIEENGANQFFVAATDDFIIGEIGDAKQIHCSNLPLAAPVKDAAAPIPVEAGAEAGPKPPPAKADAGNVLGDDDDDASTSTDPTEPEGDSVNGELPPTVKINSACSAAPGAAGSSFGGFVALGALALVRRRRRR